ncbi:MAG: hypothetical protein LUC45_06090 [Paraprevotella sp.]|nr:hypothetical protein [Paraprevotella sp.]
MTKRRILKRNINYICSELFAECVALTHYKTNTDPQDVDNVMGRILLMRDEFINCISHTEPGNSKGFFRKLRSDFSAQVDDVVSSISQLC